jgi:hypothetical protein
MIELLLFAAITGASVEPVHDLAPQRAAQIRQVMLDFFLARTGYPEEEILVSELGKPCETPSRPGLMGVSQGFPKDRLNNPPVRLC